MRSMFQVGFDREIFTPRHPNMGISISDLESFWKANYPTAKADLKPLFTQQVPGTTPKSPTNLTTTPPPPTRTVSAPSSGGSSAVLWVAGLGVAGLGAYYFLSDKPFGMKKKK